MGLWELQYNDDEDWIPFDGTVEQIIEELDGHEEAIIKIPNTSANRSFVASDQLIKIFFDEDLVFLGVLYGVEYSAKSLRCIIYNGIYELMMRRVISGEYSGIPANVVAEAVRVAAGIINPLGACPTTPISVVFDQTLCIDAIKEIAAILNKNYYTVDGETLYIGTRGSAESFDNNVANASSRTVDRAKKRDKVHVRGFDEEGNQLMGYAGTGDNVAVYWSHVATDLATLNLIAAQKLALLNTDDSSVVLTCPITSGVHLLPGDTITVTKSQWALSGSYQVVKTTKRRKTVDVEVARKKKTTEDILEELLKNRSESFSYASKGVEVIENLTLKPTLICGATIKESFDLSTLYLKQACILPSNIAVAAPTGNMNSYEAGYVCLALIYKNGTGERTLARDILDVWAAIQNADGSWYQQYNPYKNPTGGYDRVETIGGDVSGDLKVDSGAALLAWAMSYYDNVTAGTRYKTVVQKALQFLRDLQYAHLAAHSTNLIANLVLESVIDTYALLADCAECLLAMQAALDAYGDPLLTSGGYNVKTMANDLYYSMCVTGWVGGGTDYYHTSYPTDGGVLIPFTFKEKISYTQALCSWANYEWANSGYLTVADMSSQCELCLDFILPLVAGQWGGIMYAPYYGAVGETQEEFAGYTGLMLHALVVVNSSKYADDIARLTAFLKWIALEDGRIFDTADEDGRLWRAKVAGSEAYEEAYGFLALPVAHALFAGA